MTNSELIKEYNETQSERAFSDLVKRYLDLVYSACLRQTKDPHLVEEVAQSVFIILSKKGYKISERESLAGWLLTTARYASKDALKLKQRREFYQTQAPLVDTYFYNSEWANIEPFLDDALLSLNSLDRDCVITRFFQKKSLAELASIFCLSETAAQKRISRAIEKLRHYFSRRGITITSGILITLMTSYTLQAAPSHLAVTYTLQKSTSPFLSTLTIPIDKPPLPAEETQSLTYS